MILLDTNVLSELMRPAPSPLVQQWLASQPGPSVFISAITEAELRYGAALLPPSRKRAGLVADIDAMLEKDFGNRILPFDSLAARAFAIVASERRQVGKPISQADAQIAAVARSRGAILATRDVRDFENCGIALVNPWAS